jgi:uncharacterized protein (TIGR02118 family)
MEEIMVKLIYAITRKAGVSVEEFQRHWRETHGPIAAKMPGCKRYVQSHVLPQLYESEHQPAYDGVAELWFDDYDTMQASFRSPEAKDARADELLFIDHSKSFLIITEEKPVLE